MDVARDVVDAVVMERRSARTVAQEDGVSKSCIQESWRSLSSGIISVAPSDQAQRPGPLGVDANSERRVRNQNPSIPIKPAPATKDARRPW